MSKETYACEKCGGIFDSDIAHEVGGSVCLWSAKLHASRPATGSGIDYGSGHKAVDNGVGDYDMVCPTLGSRGFVPYMLAQPGVAKGKRCACGYVLAPELV